MPEIKDFFDKLAFQWDEINHHDEDKIKRLLDLIEIREGAEILDVGCGTGILEEYLLRYSPKKIVAIDLSPNMIKIANTKYTNPNIAFKCQDLFEIQGEVYDYIIIYSAFPHFLDISKLIKHSSTLLKQKGKLVICHSEGKDKINQRHQQGASQVSIPLGEAIELAQSMRPYFHIEHVIDTKELYLVSGKKCEEKK